MSLRSRLLAIFAALAVLPLLALAVFDYARSKLAVDQLIASQTAPIAERAAERVAERFAIARGDLRMIAESDDARHMLRAAGSSNVPIEASPYLMSVWRTIDASYVWLAIRDDRGRDVATFTNEQFAPFGTELSSPADVTTVIAPVTDANGNRTGTVVGALRSEALAPAAVLETRFGVAGYTLLTDTAGDILSQRGRRPLPRIISGGWGVDPNAAAASVHTPVVRALAYRDGDTTWIGNAALIPGSPLAVISAGAADEFSPTFARIRGTNLLVALSITACLLLAFVAASRRLTQPLVTLTNAAEEVGRGNFAPPLPEAPDDDVGRLTRAFAAMSGQIQRMVGELEQSRQMAAVGSFSRQIAHEIRNPLTAIKLNLQTLERDARDGRVHSDSRRTVEICLEEIQRLDRVVRGVLTLGRPDINHRSAVSLSEIVEHALNVVRPQLAAHGIAVRYEPPATPIVVDGQRESLAGVFLNLFVNSAEAMSGGGTLDVRIERGEAARVIVKDSGPGVSDAARARIFEPFYSTKANGSGLGLAVAARDVEQHRGRLRLADDSPSSGATFIVELPLEAAATG